MTKTKNKNKNKNSFSFYLNEAGIDRVRFELTHNEKFNETMIIVMEVLDNPIARKWFSLWQKALTQEGPCLIEKNYCFLGFPESTRHLPFLCNEYKKFADEINRFSSEGGWKNPYQINFVPTPRDLTDNPIRARKILNDLHHHFERLQGQAWDLSDYFTTASDPIKFAIRNINQICHEMDFLLRSLQAFERDPESCAPFNILSLLCEDDNRYPLSDEDYEHFDLKMAFGDAFLSYCQSGKTHLEAFLDKDEVIERNNISGLRYYSPDFVIFWGREAFGGPQDMTCLSEFRNWLIRHQYDPEEKKLGLGFCKIGKFPMAQFSSKSLREIHKRLSSFSNISKISLHREGMDETIVERNFPQRWTDPDHFKEQISLLYED